MYAESAGYKRVLLKLNLLAQNVAYQREYIYFSLSLFFFFLILFIRQKYVTILTIVHLDKCSCIGH